MKKYLMKCGHIAQAKTNLGEPCCVLCVNDKNAFVIEADDRRLIDSKIVIARIQQIAKEKCATLGKGHTVFYANYYKIEKLEGDEST